jgi:drug/metabolite transporter (DMT)-like permease
MVAVTLGFLILKEPISLDVVVGLSIVVGGVALVVSGERRTRQLLAEQPQ